MNSKLDEIVSVEVYSHEVGHVGTAELTMEEANHFERTPGFVAKLAFTDAECDRLGLDPDEDISISY